MQIDPPLPAWHFCPLWTGRGEGRVEQRIMKKAFFRFYEELNDFLPAPIRKREFPYEFDGRPAVKHVIESIGEDVPVTNLDVG